MVANATGPFGDEKTPKPRLKRFRFLPLLLLAVATVVSVPLGMFGNAQVSDTEAAPAQSQYPNCQSAESSDALPLWNDKNEAIWAANTSELTQTYVQGPQGWMFWNDVMESYASQAVGRVSLTDTQVLQWRKYLSSVSGLLESQGIAFYTILAPSTSSVYPEELPTWMQSIRSKTSADQIAEVVTDLPVIDLRDPLRTAAIDSSHHLFSWSNSHWTDYGGYRAWSFIANCVNSDIPAAGVLQVPVADSVEIVGDFNEWAPYGGKSPGEDWSRPVFDESKWQPVERTNVNEASEIVDAFSQPDLTKSPIRTVVPQSWTGKSALIFRDSMGGALAPYFQQAYSPLWQVGQGWTDPAALPDLQAMIDQYHPDVVVFEFAERHLINAPSTSPN